MNSQTQIWFNAAKNNDSNLIKQFIKANFDIEKKNHSKRTALHVAAENGSIEVAILLLKCGANLEARMSDNGTPLMDAVACDQLNMVTFLIDRGANTKIQDDTDWSLMHWAAHENCLKLVKILHQHDPNLIVSKRWNGITPLHLVPSADMVKKLLALGAPINAATNRGNTPLLEAVYQNRMEVAICLVREGANILQENYQNESALTLSAQNARLYRYFQSILTPSCNKKGTRVRNKTKFTDNVTAALSATKADLEENLIEIHASRRIDLYFYTLIAYYNTRLKVQIAETHIQHGQGKTHSPACHSAILTALWDTEKYAPSHRHNTRNNSGITSYYTGILDGTHFEDSLNATIELDISVNYFDSNYIEGKTKSDLKMRVKALTILNQVSLGQLDPIQGTNLFLEEFYQHLISIKKNYFNKDELKTSPRQTRELIYNAQFKGTFFNSCNFKTQQEKPETIKLKEDYIQAMLPLTKEERNVLKQSNSGLFDQTNKILKKSYERVKQEMDLPVQYQA